jgi:hypothetical protein
MEQKDKTNPMSAEKREKDLRVETRREPVQIQLH